MLPQALEEPEIWVPEMDKEIGGLEKIGAWKLVLCEPGMNLVGNKWVYAQKFLGDDYGTWKPKARLVAKGFQVSTTSRLTHRLSGLNHSVLYAL